MACAWLCELTEGRPAIPPWLAGRIDATTWEVTIRLVRSGFVSPVTTSMGRLFDAVSALCGLRLEVRYEGQAAIELECAARQEAAENTGYPFPGLQAPDGPIVLDARETLRGVLADLAAGVSPRIVAQRFHVGVAGGTAAACILQASRHGVDLVVLSGGVFQNVTLLERTAAVLAQAGLRVLVPSRLPPNDGGISYGQAAIAAARGA